VDYGRVSNRLGNQKTPLGARLQRLLDRHALSRKASCWNKPKIDLYGKEAYQVSDDDVSARRILRASKCAFDYVSVVSRRRREIEFRCGNFAYAEL
jgi:hypothetical protein